MIDLRGVVVLKEAIPVEKTVSDCGPTSIRARETRHDIPTQDTKHMKLVDNSFCSGWFRCGFVDDPCQGSVPQRGFSRKSLKGDKLLLMS